MNRLFDQHQPLFRHIFLAEWFLLILAMIMNSLALPFRHGLAVQSMIVSLVMLTMLALLSLQFPDRPTDRLLKRVCFIAAHFILVTAVLISGISTVSMPLYLLTIAKICLLLEGRPRSVVLGFCLFAAPVAYSVKVNIAYILGNHALPSSLITVILCGILVNIGNIGLMCVVAVWMLSLVSEQRLRDKAERLSREVESLAKEVERARIAREVHDTLGHTLTSLKLQLEVVRRFEGVDAFKAREALQTAEQLAARSLSDVRITLGSIRNADSSFNFNEAVDALVKDAQSSEVLSVQTELVQADIPGTVGYQLFRILQECMTNTLKHAEAKSVKITATACDGIVKLVFKDDGKGLNGSSGADRYGMKGMQERVGNLKGKLSIESASDGGTQVTVEVPIEGAAT